MHGRLHHLRLESRALLGNPLGDPTGRDVYVYAPPHDGRLPSVLLLPAFLGDARSFLDGGPFRPSVVDRFDAAVARGECPPALLVMPDASTAYGGSQYLDSRALGSYQSHLVDEVLPFVDARFPTIAEPLGRVVAGRSSGGFGALRLALDRPREVGAVVAHAADAAFDRSLPPSMLALAVAALRSGGLAAFATAMRATGPKEPGDHDALFGLAAAAAYLPAEGSPLGFEAPVDLADGRIVPDAMERMSAHDPVVRLANDPAVGRDLRFAFVDAGISDEHGLAFGARAIAAALAARGVQTEHTLHPGGHRGTSHRFDVSLPAALRALASARGGASVRPAG